MIEGAAAAPGRAVPFAALSAVGLAYWLREDPTRLVRGTAATTLLPERSSPIGVGVAVGVGVVSETHPVTEARDWSRPWAGVKRARVDPDADPDADPER